MDWFRYADSHGSEGDPTIPNAWRYRDYLIRALNVDLPYDQLVREHVAGDLLVEPRVNKELGLNESAIRLSRWFSKALPTAVLKKPVNPRLDPRVPGWVTDRQRRERQQHKRKSSPQTPSR